MNTMLMILLTWRSPWRCSPASLMLELQVSVWSSRSFLQTFLAFQWRMCTMRIYFSFFLPPFSSHVSLVLQAQALIHVTVNLLRFLVAPEQPALNSHPPYPSNLSVFWPLAVPWADLCTHACPFPVPRCFCSVDQFADDQPIFDQLDDLLMGVGIGDSLFLLGPISLSSCCCTDHRKPEHTQGSAELVKVSYFSFSFLQWYIFNSLYNHKPIFSKAVFASMKRMLNCLKLKPSPRTVHYALPRNISHWVFSII